MSFNLLRGVRFTLFSRLPRIFDRCFPKATIHQTGIVRHQVKRSFFVSCRLCEDEKEDKNKDGRRGSMSRQELEEWAQDAISQSLKQRFKVFRDEDAKIILDAEEIQQLKLLEPEEQEKYFSIYEDDENDDDEFAGFNLKRGIKGVFDVAELVDVLKNERAKDICVIEVASELHYTDHLVLATAFSKRHVKALTEFIRKLYKRKKHEADPYIDIGGKTCEDWKVLDFGNIVLHIFLAEIRSQYDLETLWTVGREFDDLSNQKIDDILTLMQPHIKYLEEFQPLQQQMENTRNDELQK